MSSRAFAPLGRALLLGVCVLGSAAGLRAEAPEAPPAVPAAEELDRPGEVENPFPLRAGTFQVVTYLLAANGEGREDSDLGTGGSAELLQSGVRFGLAGGWEGQVFEDTYVHAVDRGPDGDDPAVARAGIGFVTLRAKWQVAGNKEDDGGVALVPLIRFSVHSSLTSRTGAEPGLIVAYDLDLDHGLELQGSSGVTWSREDEGNRTVVWENQVGLDWQFQPRWTAYLEPELEAGPGSAQWAVEGGGTWQASRAWQFDLGYNRGVGRSARGHFAYLGVGYAF